MNKIEFDILLYLNERNNVDNQELSRTLYKSQELIVSSINNLINQKYIYENLTLTNEGIQLLESHKIDNAVILAAGMSTRFVPLNYEMPKALIKVKGEVLIERQIRQLKEKDIHQIIVVVGYMKERFTYLEEKYGVILIEAHDYKTKNNHSSVYAARKYLKNTIISSSDLYFTENEFQKYAFDSYYCSVYETGKTAERGVETDFDDKILSTFYGDKCCDIWVTLGYAFFSKNFSEKFIEIMNNEIDKKETANKFWADIQDEHLAELYMYVKKCKPNVIFEFDSLEELRLFDKTYSYDSNSKVLKKICYILGAKEGEINEITSLHKIKNSLFKFSYKENYYICDVNPDIKDKIYHDGNIYYQCHDVLDDSLKLFRIDINIKIGGKYRMSVEDELDKIYNCSKEFKKYHENSLPLCAAENVISEFANLPLAFGFQERYIMNNTYSFNMDDNFIGCEKLFPFYQMISDVCERIFNAKYTDARPFTGMHCIDMITKTICKPGERMIILDKTHGGHASVKPVVERLGIEVFSAPYDLEDNDINYDELNLMVKEKAIKYILLAPSDLIKPLNVEKIDTRECVLMWDCSQLMGLIAAGLCPNPLKTMKNIVMFGGTHKTLPGPASGLILTNDKYLHDLMETEINPKYLRHSQMHQKICLLFSLIEFEQFGNEYMSHMVCCSNYLGRKLKESGFDIAEIHETISETHQIFLRCSKEKMDTIYENAYKCEVTLNKKHKELFNGYGIRLGTQEIARYNWDIAALDIINEIIIELSKEKLNIEYVNALKGKLPKKEIHFTFDKKILDRFKNLMK